MGVDHVGGQFSDRLGHLVGSDIQRPDRHGVIGVGGYHLAIGFVVVFLAGNLVPLEIKELGSVQSDSLGAPLAADLCLFGKLDVACLLYTSPSPRD